MGRAKVTWRAEAVAEEIEAKLLRNGEAVGEALAERISARTPRSSGPGHLPGGGHAADAVRYEVTRIPGGVRISVGFERRAFYIVFREVGTSRQAASPTVLPTVLESKDLILGTLTRG